MYQNFGDVVGFDVTYRTNTFLLPFAPFIGVNHHGQSTLFGCALLSDEQEDNFVWLFEWWLRCMGGKAPGAIITDQDPAITNAIKRVFPNTRHRFCSWHISLHEDEHLQSLRSSYNPGFDEQYYKWVRKSKTIEEAKNARKKLKEKYKQEFIEPLTEKQHNEKKSWKCQRSESINSFFDGYVNSMTPLFEFVGQYAKALQCCRDEEVNEDMWTMRAKPNPCHLHKLEVRAGMVYTRKIFAKFQSEFKDSLYCVHDEVATNDGMTTYDVSYGFGGKVDSHSVRCGPSKEEFACTCGKFETSGILCKHILHIMMQCYRMEEIPKQYILARWTLAYRYSSKQSQLISTSKELVVSALASWNLQKSLNEVHDQAVSHGKLYNVAAVVVEDLKRQLYSIRKELEGLVTEQSEQDFGAQAISQDLISSNIDIRDPKRVRTKGRPKELSRIPAGKQVSQNTAHIRRQTCSTCDFKGHDSRTCGKTKDKVIEDGSASQLPHAKE
ncbi:hypothetical protein SLEP1_g55907 [Rubroshorea leprosula]|uniref:SWIM-type domain-containing protein n=1 Tax=Rubroshorea leprosula TaxID=152421 RepID=A0AAV5MGX6_9ROSI|nr:hypothetical protein SLEP1_g55907 [Rubroshorea leprosula]